MGPGTLHFIALLGNLLQNLFHRKSHIPMGNSLIHYIKDAPTPSILQVCHLTASYKAQVTIRETEEESWDLKRRG